MNKKLLVIIVAIFVALLFLKYLMTPNNGFNLIFYSIHELISPGGSGETSFIRTLDVLSSFIIFFLCCWLLKFFIKLGK
jgi:hypothetical protein